MHYLEDDLDLLEGVPEEVKRQCYEMRELDARVEKALAEVRSESCSFFNALKSLSEEERTKRSKKIKETYQLIREMSEEKLVITEFLETVLEKYQERIAKDLNEFKTELETDTPGITSTIEKELSDSLRPHRKPLKLATSLASASAAADTSTADEFGLEDVKPSTSSMPNNCARSSRGSSISDHGSDSSKFFADDKKPSTFFSSSHKHEGKGDRKHSRTLGPSSKLNFSPSVHLNHVSTNGHKEKRQKLMSQYSPVPAKINKASSSSASATSQSPASWHSSGFSVPSTPLSSHRSSHHVSSIHRSSHYGSGSNTQRYSLQKLSTLSVAAGGGGGGSVASSSASTTPSPPTSSVAMNNVNAGGPFGRSHSLCGYNNSVSPPLTPLQQTQMSVSSNSSASAAVMPTFAGGQESQYGRPVKKLDSSKITAVRRDQSFKTPVKTTKVKARNDFKRNRDYNKAVLCKSRLTSRVQQMLKDRQTNRAGRSPMATGLVNLTSMSTGSLEDRLSVSSSMNDDDSRDSNFRRRNDSNGSCYYRQRLMTNESDSTAVFDNGEMVHDEEFESEEEQQSAVSENGDELAVEEEEEDSEDQDNRVWCICQQKSEGDMVACDNKLCPYEWFHYDCVGIMAPPRGKWFCPECTKNMRRSRSMESR